MIEMLSCLVDLSEILEKDLTITSANDSQHMRGSLHYKDLALDIRTRDLTKDETVGLKELLEIHLGPDYDIIIESNHIHIEYDKEK